MCRKSAYPVGKEVRNHQSHEDHSKQHTPGNPLMVKLLNRWVCVNECARVNKSSVDDGVRFPFHAFTGTNGDVQKGFRW